MKQTRTQSRGWSGVSRPHGGDAITHITRGSGRSFWLVATVAGLAACASVREPSRGPETAAVVASQGSADLDAPCESQPKGPVPPSLYESYVNELKERIWAHWVYPREAAERHQSGRAVIEFKVNKDGTLRRVRVLQTSGVDILDKYAVNAVRFASGVSPIPDSLKVDCMTLAVGFRYVSSGGGPRVEPLPESDSP